MMRTQTPIVAGAGVCCVDHMFVTPQIQWGDSVHMSDYMVQGGGLVGTAIVACARLGAQCDLFTLLGDDSVGEEIVAELVAEGIPPDGIRRIKGGSSPFSFVHIDKDSGERTIFHHEASGLSFDPGEFPSERAVTWDALLVDSYYLDLAMAAAKAARLHCVPVIADIIPEPTNRELIEHVDILIAPKHYASQLGLEDDLPKALDAIHSLGPTTAVITLGAEGCVFSSPEGTGRGDAFSVEVVDTTGAGDTFHGAFAYGTARGWDIAKCAEFASAVAAIKCTKTGGRTGLPSLSQATKFLKERSGLDW